MQERDKKKLGRAEPIIILSFLSSSLSLLRFEDPHIHYLLCGARRAGGWVAHVVPQTRSSNFQ